MSITSFCPDLTKSHFENGIALAMEMGFDLESEFDSFVECYVNQHNLDDMEQLMSF